VGTPVSPPRGTTQPPSPKEVRRPPKPEPAAWWVMILCVLAVGVIAGFGAVVFRAIIGGIHNLLLLGGGALLRLRRERLYAGLALGRLDQPRPRPRRHRRRFWSRPSRPRPRGGVPEVRI